MIQEKMLKITVSFLVFLPNIFAYSEDIKGPPIAQQKELKTIVRLGEDVKIQCPIQGNPAPIIEWKRGDETIDYTFIRIRTKGRQLRIKKSQEDDTGVYVCKGVNGFGNVEVRVDLIVIDPAKFPDLKDGELPDVTAPVFTRETLDNKDYFSKQSGDSLKIACEAKGNPEPEIFWFKDGVPFDADGIKYKNGKSSLKMKNLMQVDSAVYSCQAKNLVGFITRNFTLHVASPYSETRPVVSGSGNTTIVEGDTASLQCRVKSMAPPHIKWLKKQNPNTPSDAYTIDVGEDRYRVIHTGEDIPLPGEGYLNKLVIPNAKVSDSGLYICFVTNSAGSINYKPSYLNVFPRNNVERHDSYPPTTGESTSILVLVISLGIIVILILIFIIVCVVKKSSKSSETSESPDVVRTLMVPSRSTQSNSTITTVASNKFDHPLPPPPSIWTSTMHKSATNDLFTRDFSSLHENSSQNLLSDRESPVSVGGNQYEVPYCYGTQDIIHDTRYHRPLHTIQSSNTGVSEHTGHYPFRHYPYFQYLNDYDSY